MNVQTIMMEWLKEHGYDGLVSPDAECGCDLEELMVCNGDCSSCLPGYKGPDLTGDYDYLIFKTKAAADHARERMLEDMGEEKPE